MAADNVHNPYLVNSLVTAVLSSYPHQIPAQKRWLFRDGYLIEAEIVQLQADEVALYSITPANDANTMSVLCANLPGMRDLGRKPVITDGCACVGGNVLSFALSGLFANVNAVELDRSRASMLEHNVSVIRARAETPVNIFTGSYTELLHTLSQDIVFLDPPWGGPEYKQQKTVNLFLGEKHLADVVHDLHSDSQTKYVVWKAPTNFAFDEMSEKLTTFGLEAKVLMNFTKYILYYVQLRQ